MLQGTDETMNESLSERCRLSRRDCVGGEGKLISHIGIVTVHVQDLDRAVQFYTDRLGFEKRMDAPMGPDLRWVTVAPTGGETQIVLACGFADDAGARIGLGTGIVFNTSDIDATYRELSGRGVMFTEPPTRYPFGMQAQFVDQDNNGYVLVQVPAE